MDTEIQGFWGFASDDVWAVGTPYETAPPHGAGAVLHWDGVEWHQMLGTTNAGGYSIRGTSSEDVWVSESSELYHYDGNQWSIGLQSSQTGDSFCSLWASSTDDVWLTTFDGSLHFDGATWSEYAIDPHPGCLSSIWGVAADDVYDLDAAGAILHWDGHLWTRAANLLLNETFSSTWASGPTDLYGVGFGGRITHYDGTSWTSRILDKNEDLTEIRGSSSTNIWVVGHQAVTGVASVFRYQAQ